MKNMNTRYRLILRGIRGGMFYCVDKTTGRRTSLQTTNSDEARQIVEAKNQAERQPVLNLQIAKAYLAGMDNGIKTRTWQQAIEALTNSKQGANKERWSRVIKDRALGPLLPKVIIETQGESLLRVLQSGTVSTNVYLRRLHNFCIDMNWLPKILALVHVNRPACDSRRTSKLLPRGRLACDRAAAHHRPVFHQIVIPMFLAVFLPRREAQKT
jgi:hypothetical protein